MNRWLFRALLALSLSVSFAGRAQTLHAVLVADTRDPLLRRACAYDLDLMHQQVTQVAAALGYRLDEHLLTGDDFSRKRLDSVLRALSPQPDDVLLFYYTGHGYNQAVRPDRYPVLMLEKDAARLRRNPRLAAIHALLKSKKARLCVTLGDCCNNVVTSTRGMVGKRIFPKGVLPLTDSLKTAYRTLFLNVTGDALIASSAPPQQACAHPDSGSFYTRAFDEALLMASRYRAPVSWEILLRDAQTRLTRHAATRTKQSIFEVHVVPVQAIFSPVALRADTAGQAVVLPRKTLDFHPPTSIGDAARRAEAAPLRVELRTDRGRDGVEYRQGNRMLLDVKATRPCHLRLVYLLADGTKTLLENDFEIKPGQENGFVRVAPDVSLVCSEPFGTETLLAYAAEAPFCPLPTQPNARLYVRPESGYTVLVGSLGEALRAVRCTPDGLAVAEDRLQLTTRPGMKAAER